MCFSATSSFTIGSFLMANGLYIYHRREIPSNAKYLAAIPFVFAVHQITEGFVWLGVENVIPSNVSKGSAYFYTLIANSFWPIFVPFSMYKLERSNLLKKVQLLFLSIGFLTSAYLFWAYTFHDPVLVHANCLNNVCSSLAYNFSIPHFSGFGRYIYLLAVVLPMLFTKEKKIRLILCPIFCVSFLLASLFSYSNTFASVWCFFAAIISIVLVFVFSPKEIHKFIALEET